MEVRFALALCALLPAGGAVLQAWRTQTEAIVLLAEGFDMLEEDFDKERFFATVRRAYWDLPDGSPDRQLMQRLIGKLDF